MNAVEIIQDSINMDSICSVLEYYGVNKIYRMGSSVRCCCPLHGGNNPTSFVWKDNGLWYCHTRCNTGSDVFGFVAIKENLDLNTQFKAVVNKVAEILNINIENATYDITSRRNNKELEDWKRFVKSKKEKNINEEYNLAQLGDLKQISRYRGITQETLELFEVSYSKEHDRIVFPIRDEIGKCIGATMRRRDNTKPIKWLHQPTGLKVGEHLYGLHLANSDVPFLVEGAIDVLKLRDLGISALGCFGAKLTDEQVKILIKNFTSVNLMYDGDKAGMDATYSAMMKLKDKMDINIYVLPFGVDPGEIMPTTWENIKIYKPYQFEEVYNNMEKCI